MPRRETLNNANTTKIMAETFGRYNIFATLSLSLSLRRSPTRESYHILLFARDARVKGSASRVQSQACLGYAEAQPALARKGNIRLFLHSCKFWSSESKGKLVCTLPSRDKTRPKVKRSRLVFCPRRTLTVGTATGVMQQTVLIHHKFNL